MLLFPLNMEQSDSSPTLFRWAPQAYSSQLLCVQGLRASCGCFDPQDFSHPCEAANANPTSVHKNIQQQPQTSWGKIHTSGSSFNCSMVENCMSLSSLSPRGNMNSSTQGQLCPEHYKTLIHTELERTSSWHCTPWIYSQAQAPLLLLMLIFRIHVTAES